MPGIGCQRRLAGAGGTIGPGFRSRRDPLQRPQVFGEHEVKRLAEMEPHFAHPLRHQPLGGDDQRPFDQPPQFEFADDQAGLDGLAQPDLVGQEVADPVVGDRAGEGPDLVRQRDDRRLDGGQQQVLSQGVGHPGGGGDVGDVVWGTIRGGFRGFELRSGNADYRVGGGQPHPAGRFAPERLGLDDLAELAVLRTVVPTTICDHGIPASFLILARK